MDEKSPVAPFKRKYGALLEQYQTQPRNHMSYLLKIAQETPELDGLHISCRSSLYRRMGITTKAQVLDGLANGEIAVNNGKIWGKRRHQRLLDWLEPLNRVITEKPL
jgi:hypothetical protein